jgi:hypothetical protein
MKRLTALFLSLSALNELNYTPELRDPEHFDFRPKADASLIDGGMSVPGLTDSFEGKAPDIGAYEHGGINWRPGYRRKAALFYRDTKAYDKPTD